MYLARIWRYPVKSLSGEMLPTARLTRDGVEGDRTVHVASPHGVLTGRTRHDLLTIAGSTGPDGVPQVAGQPWNNPAAAATVRAAAGPDARLVAHDGPARFDVLNLLVATDGAVAMLGTDVRRLRPNLLIGDVPANAERTWPGHELHIGDAVIGIHSVRQRCIVTTIDPDTGAQDLNVLRRIRQQFDNAIGLDSWVIRPGVIHVGDPVTLHTTTERPSHVGGWIVGAPYSMNT
jgi:uncharacterized protein YcbX